MEKNSLHVIVVTRNGSQLIAECLDAIVISMKRARIEGDLTIIDNGSTDASKTREIADRLGCQFVGLDRNFGVAAAWNLASARVTTGKIVFVNQDAIIQEECIRVICETLDQSTVPTVVGAKLYFPGSNIIQHAGAELVPPRYDGRHIGHKLEDKGQFDVLSQVNYVTGAVFGCLAQTLVMLHGFDQRFAPAYYEDVDFCWRLRANGGSILFQPKAVGYHAAASSQGWANLDLVRTYTRNRLLFVSIHLSLVQLKEEFAKAETEWLNMLDKQRSMIIEGVYKEYICQVPQLFDPTKSKAITEIMASIIGG